jgi:bifunctional UDP-N-acetylglucosamine pyrophosphorylase/glucosamine-1-phosphate N-acetyltransferase
MISTIILAAGKGTRLKSEKPKVLHEIKNKPSVFHVIDLAKNVSDDIITIIGYRNEEVKSKIESEYDDVKFALQVPQNGTADAVLKGIPYLNNDANAVIVLSGDAPALTIESLNLLIDEFNANNRNVSFIGAKIPDPAKYGRVVLDENNNLHKIVEFIDASEEEKKIDLVNSGVYMFDINYLKNTISKVEKNDNGEFFLPDLIEFAAKDNKAGLVVIDNYNEILGFNTKEQLELLNSF